MLHTVFNIITTLILVWFCPQIAKLVSTILKMPKSTDEQEVFRLKYIEGGPVSTAELYQTGVKGGLTLWTHLPERS